MDQNKLYKILQSHQIFKDEELDAYVHALVDINDSINKIYSKYVNDILVNSENKEAIINAIWAIREEFRHISYHIDDANLTE